MPDQKDVGERLARIRQAVGLTKTQISSLTSTDKSSWSKIENGERPLPLRAAWAIYRAFGFSLDYIYDGRITDLPTRYRDAVLVKRDDAD